ncbi:hypothetical protein Ciccas_004310 [Cichlidogyrus casuarinus]|uniref:Uncharacterized protein n=1 Tax=Cichlidogyrus casuarinus TaxID=1844966 RepID=A0ABD2QBU4_9PLAT
MQAELAVIKNEEESKCQPVGRVVFQKKSSVLEKQLLPLLTHLLKMHNEAYKKKANQKNFFRRIVCGFHEVANYLTQQKLKLIVIARDIEGKAGLYECINSKEDFDSVLQKYHFKEDPEASRPTQFNRFGIPKIAENENHTNISINLAIKLKEARNTSLDEYIKMIYCVAKQLKCPVFYGYTRRELKGITRKPNLVSCLGVLSIQDIKRDFDDFMESFDELLPQPFFQTFEPENLQSQNSISQCDLTNLAYFFDEISIPCVH